VVVVLGVWFPWWLTRRERLRERRVRICFAPYCVWREEFLAVSIVGVFLKTPLSVSFTLYVVILEV